MLVLIRFVLILNGFYIRIMLNEMTLKTEL